MNNRFNQSRKYESIQFEFKEKGFRNEKGNIRPELLLNEAKYIAEKFVEQKLSKTQLRAFYGEVKGIESRIENKESFEKNLYSILLLKAKAAYKFSSKGPQSKITKDFKSFIDVSVDIIAKSNSYEVFNDFCVFFEAIVGYFY